LLNRYDGYIRSRIMAATLSVPRLELFEDPALVAQADRTVRFVGRYPGEIVCGYAEKWSAQAQGLAAAVVVATVWPLAAAPLALLWFLIGRRLQVDYARTEGTWAERRRRAYYLKEVGVRPAWAKEVRIFGLVGWLADRFGREWGQYLSQLRHARRRESRTVVPLFMLIVVANAGVLALAVRSALSGDLSVGALTVLVQGLFAMPFLANQDSDHLVEMGSIPTAELVGLEASVGGIPAPEGQSAVADRPRHEIRLEGVRFAYPASDAAVFDRLDLSIEAGRSLGVVGLNGAGKTTLIKLLTGLERPQHGSIKVDGTDLDDLDQTSWRRCIAAIFQDFVRYEMSARDNIGFGALSRTDQMINIDDKIDDDNIDDDVDDMITTAALNAGADAMIRELPDGLSTVLSRRFTGGVDLSGGQWQRIALARAMAAVQAGARVLVLDEPTAHLDARAEADIYDRFLDLTDGLTTIVISHRFSTVRRADRIVVLDSGRITEDGTHDELLAADGQYARLFRTQADRYTGATHA
jgi:ATP-binding cassette, subfamily B, bacterial